jgi:hypothetical protein
VEVAPHDCLYYEAWRSPSAALIAHHALNARRRQYRMPIHDAGALAAFYDAPEVPFREVR